MAKEKNINKASLYRFNLIEDESHRLLWTRKFTKTGVLIWGITAIVVLLAVFFSLIAFTPIRTTIPGYPDAHSKRMAVQNAMRIDSLESIIYRWQLYAENLSRIVDGETPIRLDSILKVSGNRVEDVDRESLAGRDSVLRSTVMEAEQFDVSNGQTRVLPIEGIHFFSPVKGVVARKFDLVMHPYLDINAPSGSLVTSILDGTVISAGWSDAFGYSIMVQHSSDMVSIYRYNQKLLKKTGDKVSAGAPIALLGGAGDSASGDHLHFELWYQGEAIDPAKFISF